VQRVYDSRFEHPVASDCTPEQMPDVSDVKAPPVVKIAANTVDPAVTFLPTDEEFAGYPA